MLEALGRADGALAHLRQADFAEPFRPHLTRRLILLEARTGNADAAVATQAAALGPCAARASLGRAERVHRAEGAIPDTASNVRFK